MLKQPHLSAPKCRARQRVHLSNVAAPGKVDVTPQRAGPHRQVGAFFRGVILIGASRLGALIGQAGASLTSRVHPAGVRCLGTLAATRLYSLRRTSSTCITTRLHVINSRTLQRSCTNTWRQGGRSNVRLLLECLFYRPLLTLPWGGVGRF